MSEPLPLLEPREFKPLDPDAEHRGRQGYYFVDRALCNAANTAHLLGRPLLLTGEPGCGKTDFAWVMAHAVGFRPTGKSPEPLQCHVRSEMSARDLLYHYDALLRFVDAQHSKTVPNLPDGAPAFDPQDPSRYFELRGLGQALVWPRDERPVLLIDEIDKAPRDLPNDLLQALDVGEFRVAELRDDQEAIQLGDFELRRTMGHGQPASRRPFVVITSNVEQQLPEPFLRRCVFFHIRFPQREALVNIVRSRLPRGHDGQAHRLRDPLIKAAVDVFVALRNTRDLGKAPATSELLDWTETLARYWRPQQVGERLKAYAAQIANRGGKDDDKLALEETEHVRWRDLPGLECLLKLRDDLERVHALR